VILENLGIAHIAAKRVDRLVTGLIHHLKNARAALGGRREEARAERVASEQCGIEADILGITLKISATDCADSRSPILPPFRIERNTGPVVMPAASCHAFSASTGHAIEPAHDGDRRAFAFLIGLAEFDSDFETRLAFLDVLAIERHELRPAEGAGKPEQQQGAVTDALQAVAGSERHRDDMLACGWRLLAGRRSERPADAPHRRLDHLGIGRDHQAGELVRVPNCRDAATDVEGLMPHARKIWKSLP
jgi:hypothetical protein